MNRFAFLRLRLLHQRDKPMNGNLQQNGCLLKRTVFSMIVCALTALLADAQTIYTDRPTWQAAVSILLSEDFESEPNVTGFDLFSLPYTTVNGVTIDELGSGSAQQFLATGLVNGTQEPHIRDFASMITWGAATSFTAFGFDYDTVETWDVKIGSSAIATLPIYSNGFFGVTAAGWIGSFTLAGGSLPGGAQGGISVDDMAFAVPEAATLALCVMSLFAISLLRVCRRLPRGERGRRPL